jgi:hypothetical protein
MTADQARREVLGMTDEREPVQTTDAGIPVESDKYSLTVDQSLGDRVEKGVRQRPPA